MTGDSGDSDSSARSDAAGRGSGAGRGQASHGPRECMACRGSGQVISNLGGVPSKVSCPWCGGGGVRVPGVDAQARWIAQGGESDRGGVAAP